MNPEYLFQWQYQRQYIEIEYGIPNKFVIFGFQGSWYKRFNFVVSNYTGQISKIYTLIDKWDIDKVPAICEFMYRQRACWV